MTAPSKTVDFLLLSTSTVNFTEGDPAHTLVALPHAAIERKQPEVDWRCEGGLFCVTPTMAARAKKMVEERRPQVAILRPTGNAFMHDEVVSRIRERWPALYPLAMKLDDFFRSLVGEKRRGAEGSLGELFRIPRRLAVRFIGLAPPIRGDQPTEIVNGAIDTLIPLEDVEIVCSCAVGNSETFLPPEEHERREEYFLQAVEAHCRQRHVPSFRDHEGLREARVWYVYGEEQWHSTLAFRQVDAELIADLVLQALADRPTLRRACESGASSDAPPPGFRTVR